MTINEPRWAGGALRDDPVRTLTTLHNGLTVSLIATARVTFETCTADEPLAFVVERNCGNAFDFLPVIKSESGSPDGSARIIGLLEVIPYRHGTEPHGMVREAMRPLLEENLIGANASIINFVRNADRQRCRLVVSGSEISGLVSLSDLQRLPVRAALFAMITQLEMIMANCIRSDFAGSDGWIERISKDRRCDVGKKAASARSDDGFVDLLLFTQFADKMTIIKKSAKFGWSRSAFERDLGQVQKLRDNLAHANDYAATPTAAAATCATVRLIESWIDRLSAWP
jgi:hypothetical protein